MTQRKDKKNVKNKMKDVDLFTYILPVDKGVSLCAEKCTAVTLRTLQPVEIFLLYLVQGA